MADDVDNATQSTENVRLMAGGPKAYTRKKLTACGVCHYCRCTVSRGETFCDSNCKDDYEEEQRIKESQNVHTRP